MSGISRKGSISRSKKLISSQKKREKESHQVKASQISVFKGSNTIDDIDENSSANMVERIGSTTIKKFCNYRKPGKPVLKLAKIFVPKNVDKTINKINSISI